MSKQILNTKYNYTMGVLSICLPRFLCGYIKLLIYQLKRKQTYDSENRACHCVSQTWKAMGMAAGCNVWWTECYIVFHCGGLSVKLCYTVLHCVTLWYIVVD